MSVRDEDYETKTFRRVDLYGADVEVPAWAERVIRDQVGRSPESWTPRLVFEDLREAGHDGVSEEMVAAVMQA